MIPEVYFALSELLSGKPVSAERGCIADVDDSNFDECIFSPADQNQDVDAGGGVTEALDLASDVVDYFERTSKIRKEQQADKKRRI